MEKIRTAVSTETDARGVCESGILAHVTVGLSQYNTRFHIPVCTRWSYKDLLVLIHVFCWLYILIYIEHCRLKHG